MTNCNSVAVDIIGIVGAVRGIGRIGATRIQRGNEVVLGIPFLMAGQERRRAGPYANAATPHVREKIVSVTEDFRQTGDDPLVHFPQATDVNSQVAAAVPALDEEHGSLKGVRAEGVVRLDREYSSEYSDNDRS